MNKAYTARLFITIALFAAAAIAAPYAGCDGFQYESRGKRDPFTPLVGGSRVVATRLEDITSVDDLKVEGIATGAYGRRVALINGEALKEGDKVGEIELVKIEKNSITIAIGGKSYDLYLPGENGGFKSGK